MATERGEQAVELSQGRTRLALLSLALGGFAIGSTEFVAMGLLPNIASDIFPALYSSNPELANAHTAWVISAYALGVVVGAPTIAGLAGRWPQKQLLLVLLAVFTIGTLGAVVAPNFPLLLLARFVAALPHGAYFGIASLVAARLMGPEKRGRGIALVLGGLTIANVVGVPLITWLGQFAGWRIAYAAVALLFALTFVAVAAFLPWRAGDSSATLRSQLRVFRHPQVWLALLMGAVGFGGFFAVYSYIAPIVTDITGLSDAAVPVVLVCFGLGMTLGNFVGGALVDRSVRRSIYLFYGVLLFAIVVLAVAAQNPVWLIVGVVLTGAGSSALGVGIQTRLLDVARDGQSLAAALNHSALNIGNALGAALGGVVIAWGFGYRAPIWLAGALSVLGLLIAAWTFAVDRSQRRRGIQHSYVTGSFRAVRPPS